MAPQELSQELASLFATTIQSKLSNLCALISLAEKRGFSKPNLFGIQNAIINIHSIAKTFEQPWVSEIFETKVVRPLQLAVSTNVAPNTGEIESFRDAIRECHQRSEEIVKATKASNISPLDSNICSFNPQYNSLLSAIGQISIWGYHEIMGELTKIHAYSEMVQNWIDDLRANALSAELQNEIHELQRIQERMRNSSDHILEIIRRSRGARGRIKQNREIFLLGQLTAMMLDIRSVRQDAKWLVGNMPTVDVVVDKHQFEFLWISVVKLFLDWLSPNQKIRGLCDAAESSNAEQKIALYVGLEPHSDAPIQADLSGVDFSKECPLHDVGRVFETCTMLAKFWEIDLDLGLNNRGYPVARFMLPVAGKSEKPTVKSTDADISDARPITLIVDDDKDIAIMLQKKLARFGFPAIIATDLESARLVLANQKIGAVIADLFLGEQSGLDLLTTVKKQFPDLKFVFITGATQDDVSPGLAKLLAARADATLNKPVDDETLRCTLEKLLPG